MITNTWPGFGAQKQFAVEQAKHEWIFSLDADERVSEELKKSIEKLRELSETQLADGYEIARRTYYQQRWIRVEAKYLIDSCDSFLKESWRTLKEHHIHESVAINFDARILEKNRTAKYV